MPEIKRYRDILSHQIMNDFFLNKQGPEKMITSETSYIKTRFCLEYKSLRNSFVSRIIRCQIKVFQFFVGEDCPVPIIPMRGCMWRKLFEYGPSFAYKGDEIIWHWHYKTWMSLDCGGAFKTLDDIDKFWREYDEHLKRLVGGEDF